MPDGSAARGDWPLRGAESWRARYEAGEREAVWRELADIGPIDDLDVRFEAAAVARMVMDRASIAIAELRDRLSLVDYPIRPAQRVGPTADSTLARVEASCRGHVAISLASFWRTVGEVDLSPSDGAQWPSWMPDEPIWQVALDPLVVWSLEESWSATDRGSHGIDTDAPPSQFELVISPDAFHKVDVSGGRPYAVMVPSESADSPILNLQGEPSFVPYLRTAIERAGFYGVSPTAEPTRRWRSVVGSLRKDLPSF